MLRNCFVLAEHVTFQPDVKSLRFSTDSIRITELDKYLTNHILFYGNIALHRYQIMDA